MTTEVTLDVFFKTEGITKKTSDQTVETLPQLPNGWKWVKLGDICKISAGGTPRRSVKEYWNGDIPWVKISDIPDNGLVYETEEKISKKGLENSSAKVFPKDTILFTIFATIGKVGILCINAATNQAIAGVQIRRNNVDMKYLFYCLRRFGISLLSVGRGAAQYNINQTILKNLKIPFPPLDVQRRIVSRIEEITSRIEQAKKLREEALKNTETIMQSALHQIFSKAEERGWKWKRLGDKELCKIVPGQHILSADYGNVLKGTPYITGPADFGAKYPLITKWTLKPKAFSSPGDVLLTVKGAGVGKVNCAPDHEAAIGRQIMAIRPEKTILHTEFLYAFLMYKFDYFQEIARSATVPGIRKDQLEEIKLPLPSLEEQKNIARYLNELQNKIEALKKLQEKTEKEIETITQAILKKAFSGKL